LLREVFVRAKGWLAASWILIWPLDPDAELRLVRGDDGECGSDATSLSADQILELHRYRGARDSFKCSAPKHRSAFIVPISFVPF